MTTITLVAGSEARNILIAGAERTHAAYSQYVGHWDDWVLARLKRDVKSRGATIGVKGELVLLNPESFTTEDSPDVIAGYHRAGFVTVFLPHHYVKGGCDTSVRSTWVEVVK